MIDSDFFEKPVIGVAGCGSMGLPMAKALTKSNYETWGYDTRPAAEFGLFQSRMIEHPEEFSDKCDIVISVVRDYQQTLDLCLYKQAIFSYPDPPSLLIISSTLSPSDLHSLRNLVDHKITIVDAPMSGAPIAAEERSLTFMLGGEPHVLNQLEPVFTAMGDTRLRLGKLGNGMTAKVLNNYVAASSVAAVRRVYIAAEKLNLPFTDLLKVMKESSGNTWYGSNFERISWAREKYDTTNTFGILEKDVKCALDAMYCNGIEPEPLDESILQQLRAAKAIDEQ